MWIFLQLNINQVNICEGISEFLFQIYQVPSGLQM